MKLSPRLKYDIIEALSFIVLPPLMFIALVIFILVINLVYSSLFGNGFLVL